LVTIFKSTEIVGDSVVAYLSYRIQDIVRPFKSVKHVLIQRRDKIGAPFEFAYGNYCEKSFACRGALKFELSFTQQNIGYFLDIEPVRIWLQQFAAHKKILNLFAYTCAFSVVAVSAGADMVVNIDRSQRSLRKGLHNHKINGADTSAVKFLSHDIFKSWGKLRRYGPYGIVIIDPPSFQKGSFIAAKDYVRVISKMSGLVGAGGMFVACLNAPEITRSELKRWVDQSCPEFEFMQSLAAHPDFPESNQERGLKMLVYRRLSDD